MRILLLAEGDPETRDSWSESSRSLLLALRAQGHSVIGRDVTEGGLARGLAMAASWSPSRRRWAARYHFGRLGFQARSARAREIRDGMTPAPDAVLQIGATFDGVTGFAGPAFLYCDSNARTAARSAPWADVGHLSEGELGALAAREATTYAGATGVFTMSEHLRRSFIADFDVPAERAVTVYAGANLDISKIPPRPDRTGEPPTILFVGRQWERKGGPTLLEAFRSLRREMPEARLLIAGCTPEVGRGEGIEVLGRIHKDAAGGESRLSALYHSADLFCMPSHFEPFGIVFVEAMLHEIPCIAADCCAMPEIVREGETGWLVPPGEPAVLADRLKLALGDRAALETMGLRGRERALSLFTWGRVAERLAQVLPPVGNRAGS